MRKLRDPDGGCPWDLEQDFSTIAPYTIEEAYEVADAIEREDWEELRHDLGDLLFQVVFYAQMGQEHCFFDFEEESSTHSGCTLTCCQKLSTARYWSSSIAVEYSFQVQICAKCICMRLLFTP